MMHYTTWYAPLPAADPDTVLGMTEVRTATTHDVAHAIDVWRQSNAARGKVPDAQRVADVTAKIMDPTTLTVITTDNNVIIGMAVGVPARADDGAGVPIPGLCHVAMVFVHPDRWGQGVGGALLRGFAERAQNLGYRRLQLWTGETNTRAQRLYLRHGFTRTGRTAEFGGELIGHYEADLPLARIG
jgi:ribosomal protein S18 acetylase RimI-like enzyme